MVYRPSAVRNAIKEPTDTTGDVIVEMEVIFHFLFAIGLSNTDSTSAGILRGRSLILSLPPTPKHRDPAVSQRVEACVDGMATHADPEAHQHKACWLQGPRAVVVNWRRSFFSVRDARCTRPQTVITARHLGFSFIGFKALGQFLASSFNVTPRAKRLSAA